MIFHVGVAWWDVFLCADGPDGKTARGLVRVAQYVHQFFDGDQRRVAVHRWSDSLDLLAHQIESLSPERFGEVGRLPQLKIYASGLGAAAAIHLANQLPQLSVDSLVVANPNWDLPGNRQQPELPANVVELSGFVARREGSIWPRAAHEGQRLEPPTVAGVRPEAIEDLRAFHTRCQEVARS